MRRPIAILCSSVLFVVLGTPEIVWAHGASSEDFRARVLEVTPESLPISAQVRDEQLEVENEGDELLVLCNSAEGACVGRELRPGDTALVEDERLHWQGGIDALPARIDQGDSSPQRVVDVELPVRYGDRDGAIEARIEFVGGRSWLERYGEYALVTLAVLVMLGVFVVDARRRRADGGASTEASADAASGGDDAPPGDTP